MKQLEKKHPHSIPRADNLIPKKGGATEAFHQVGD